MGPASRDLGTGRPTAGSGGELVLERIPYRPSEWSGIVAGYPDAEVFHSPEWLAYLVASQGAEPVVAVVKVGGRAAGHFVGAIVRRFGLRILGSPLRGWGTQYMGFLLEPGVDRRAAADALLRFAFRELGCIHVELADRELTGDRMVGSRYVVETGFTYLVDLGGSEDEILGRMNSRTRTYVRRAARSGLTAEVATDDEFANDYHRQLEEVFGRQGLVPTYQVERVRQLIREVGPSGQLLLLRVRGLDGAPLAASVSIGRNRIAVNWGTAFYRDSAELHPNELLWWEMMRAWRARGAAFFDMGGRGEYKAKYGSVMTPTVRFHRSRYALFRYGRSAVRRLVRVRQVVAGSRRRRAG